MGVKLFKILFVIFLFSGCASKFQSPVLDKFDEKAFQINTKSGLNTLYVSHPDENYNFTLINSLGAPLARRTLKSSGEFKNIGFLPPNSAYNELFIKVLDMITAQKNEAEILINNEKFKVKSIDIRQ